MVLDNYVEYKSDNKNDESISIKKCFDKIREHLRRMINDKRKSVEWKIQLVIKINLFLLKTLMMLGIGIVNLIMLKL